MAYPKTPAEYVKALETAAAQHTMYWNAYPYNLGYYHSNGVFSFDCNNLVKAILNGWEPIKKAGYFCSDLRRTGDCDEWHLLAQTEFSTDFSQMHCVSVLYMPGHIGSYLSKEVTRGGRTYNCIEATAAWGGGVLYSFCDRYGNRYNHKGGSQNGRWTHWGKMTKWLDYSTKPIKYKYKIGDKVDITGVHISSTDPNVLKPAKTTGTIAQIAQNTPNPYLVEPIGWCKESEITGIHKDAKPEEKSPFKDVKTTDSKYKHIKRCYDAGLVKGFDDGTFHPEEPITRGDFAVIAARLLDKIK